MNRLNKDNLRKVQSPKAAQDKQYNKKVLVKLMLHDKLLIRATLF